jgi:hypothetical protein
VSGDKNNMSPAPAGSENLGGLANAAVGERNRAGRQVGGTMMSRHSSREASIEPLSNKRLEPKPTFNANDNSDSEQEKSPYKVQRRGQLSTFGFGARKGKNILENLGDQSTHHVELKKWNTLQDRADPSENYEQSNLASHTTAVNPSSSIPKMHKQSKFGMLVDLPPPTSHQQMMLAMKKKNRTDYFPANKQQISENDDSDNDMIDQRTGPRRQHTLKRLTGINNANFQEDYKKRYRDFVPLASGSYAIVDRCQRKEDHADFVVKFMSRTKVADKIKNLLGLPDTEARELATKLCENELSVSNAMGSHPNISSIEDSYVDKLKGEYRFFSRIADFSTLLSDKHLEMLKTMNEDGSERLTPEQAKQYFRDVVDGLKHSKILVNQCIRRR